MFCRAHLNYAAMFREFVYYAWRALYTKVTREKKTILRYLLPSIPYQMPPQNITANNPRIYTFGMVACGGMPRQNRYRVCCLTPVLNTHAIVK